MSPKDDHFVEFQDHTLLKHFLLNAYLKAWGSILTKTFSEAWFIDAFAGAGRDTVGNPGSPMIAATIARDINRGLYPRGLPEKRGGMRIVCYEKDPAIFAMLLEAIAEIERDPHVSLLPKNNTLEERVGPVVTYLAKKPVLYFLDPFGIDGLSAAVTDQLLSHDHHELLMLFSDEGAIRLAGKVRAGDQDPTAMADAAEAAVREKGDLFGGAFIEADVQAARAEALRSAAGHKSNKNAKEIMDRAFGGDYWLAILEGTPEQQRQERTVALYEERVLARAPYILRFAVRTADHRHKYFLIHASRNSKAHVEMKRAMHTTRKHAADPNAMFQQFEASIPLPLIAAAIAERFAGAAHVRWQGTNDPATSVKDYIEHETPAWMHEVQDLKALLVAQHADRKPDGKLTSPLTFTFPSRS